jgi:hypothetical protein
VAQASEILGVTVEPVRGRIKRGTLEHERHSGTVYVLLDADQTPTGHQPADDQSIDQRRPDAHEDLAGELRDRIRYLERQVEEEREARRRADTLLAQLVQRVPELEAARGPRESPEAVEEQQGRGEEPRSDAPRALRRAYSAHGGAECSEDRRSMQNDQTTQDAKRRNIEVGRYATSRLRKGKRKWPISGCPTSSRWTSNRPTTCSPSCFPVSVPKRSTSYATDDYTMEWPQSGQRLRGRQKMKAFQEANAGSRPPRRLRRVLVREGLWVVEGVLDYGGGREWDFVLILELRDGKVYRETRYYAEPFKASESRAQWFERMGR